MAEPANNQDPIFELNEIASDDRIANAAKERERRHLHAQIALDEMRMSGLLLDLHESQDELQISTVGRTVRGRIRNIGIDHIVVANDIDATYVIASSSIESIEVHGKSRDVVPSDRHAMSRRELSEELAAMVDNSRRVQVTTAMSITITGHMTAVGRDMIAMTPGGDERRQIFVAANNIAMVTTIA